MKKICVFCGSASGKNPVYIDSATELGISLAIQNIGLVYGGASIGVMGAVANGCLKQNGKVWGVIPKAIKDLEVGHQGLTELIEVGSMHERKQKMYDLSDAFFALPGGFGTLDELCEIITWAQLKYHNKPCYVINENGFFDGMLQHFAKAHEEGFISAAHMELVKVFKTWNEAISDFKSMV